MNRWIHIDRWMGGWVYNKPIEGLIDPQRDLDFVTVKRWNYLLIRRNACEVQRQHCHVQKFAIYVVVKDNWFVLHPFSLSLLKHEQDFETLSICQTAQKEATEGQSNTTMNYDNTKRTETKHNHAETIKKSSGRKCEEKMQIQPETKIERTTSKVDQK